ncbi:hypothetical protein ACTXT7_015974 [Hymenolepis weldensis]
MVGNEVNKHSHITKSSLMEAMKDMNKDHLIKACSRFWTRIEMYSHRTTLGYAQSGENKKDVEWRGFIAHFSVLVKSLAIKYKTTLGCGDLNR